MSETLRRRHSSHWGAFTAIVENGRMTDVAPNETDPNPAPLLDSMPDALYADCRVEQPMERKGWLEEGPGVASARRGADPPPRFLPAKVAPGQDGSPLRLRPPLGPPAFDDLVVVWK